MMRYLILGALLGLLLVFPQLLAIVVGLLSQPVVVAFGLGIAARPYLRRPRRWAR